MADVKNVMGVDASDIKNIMGVETDDIKSVVGLDFPAGRTWLGARGVQGGGSISGAFPTNQMQYQTVTSSSETADFGNLSVARAYAAPACSGGGRMVFGDGATSSVYSLSMMDYITTASTGNATDFGDLAANSGGSGGMGCSNGTLAFYGAGFDLNESPDGSAYRDVDFSYVTILTTGNSSNAGDLSEGKNWIGSTSGDSRGLISGGYTVSVGGIDVIDYIVFSTSGNSSDFGDLSTGTYDGYAAADATRAVHFFGHFVSGSTTTQNMIEYVTVASTGDSSDFGDQPSAGQTSHGALCDGTYAETWGGYTSGSVDYHEQRYRVTVQSGGNSSDFADLSVPVSSWQSCGTG